MSKSTARTRSYTAWANLSPAKQRTAAQTWDIPEDTSNVLVNELGQVFESIQYPWSDGRMLVGCTLINPINK